jgi:hypothetical protein
MRTRAVGGLVALTFVTAVLLLALLVGGAAGGHGKGPPPGKGSGKNAKIRWDLITLSSQAGKIALNPGGSASAKADDGSEITLTGSGTFRSNPGNPQSVTGGGTWATTGSVGTASGTYRVRRFVSFVVAPGTIPAASFIDNIVGDITKGRAGLAVLKVRYSDGSSGVLTVSCHLPAGSPDSIFEGITATKGYVGFWNRGAPFGTPLTANGNRTQFRVIH